MPEISLREYATEIDQLIEEARYLEALAHVRHIISHYPRYIDAYYLLGKMLLEADQPDLAVDIFRRALNADPEHLKSRIGLGLAHEQRDDLDAAIWNLERAFELAPANADIADELRRIYGRRDGIEPDHIPISRAGLSRLYMRGNLASRAVDELRNLLTIEPNRPDLQGALAEAYWRDGQIVQAAETCQGILDDMPYHRKANLLLGTLWLNSGQEEGQIHLNRSQEVDVDNSLAVELLGTASPLKQREEFMDRLVYDLDGIDVDQQAEWFKRLEAASASVGISEAIPAMSESEVRLVDITAGLESQIEIPEWLRELGPLDDVVDQEERLSWMSDMTLGEELAGRGTVQEVEEAPEVEIDAAEVVSSGVVDTSDIRATPESTQESADWLSEFVAEELDETSEEVPDWLEEITPKPKGIVQPEQPVETFVESTDQIKQDEVEVDIVQIESPQLEVISGVLTDAVTDVVAEVEEISITTDYEDAEEHEEIAAEARTPVDEYSEQDEMAEIAEQLISEPAPEQDIGEVPDWLQAIPTTEVAAVGEGSGESDAASADLDWLDEIGAELEAEEISQPESVALEGVEPESVPQQEAVSEETPDWLQALAPSTEEVSIAAFTDDGTTESSELDWLEEITADLDSTEAEIPLEASEDLPDWLKTLTPTEEQATVMEHAIESAEESSDLDWLEEAAADLDAVEGEVPLEASKDVPDWLKTLAPAEEQTTAVEPVGESVEESSDLDWLEGFAADLDAEEGEVPLEASKDVPDWLKTLTPAEEQTTAVEPVGESVEESGDLDWLEGITADMEITESAASLETAEDLPEWLQTLSPTEDQTAEMEPVEAGEEGDADLDWLDQISLEAEQQPDETLAETPTTAESIPDWVSQLQPTSTETDKFTLSEEEIPDFLAELDKSATDTRGERADRQIDASVEADRITDLITEDMEVESVSDMSSAQEPETQQEGDFFGWQAFGEEITEVTPTSERTVSAEPAAPADIDTIETPVVDLEPVESEAPLEEPSDGLFGWDAFGETITEATPASLKVGDDVLSGDDALAWLESLTAGKEEELRAITEVESEARMEEILGRPTTTEQPVKEPEIEVPEAVFAEPEPEPEVTLYEEPEIEAVEPEPVAEVGEDVLSGDDALAWLESLTVGKEEELRAQAEVESEARIAEILGRPTTPEQPVQEPEVEAPEALIEEPEVTLYEEPEIEAVEPEPVAEAGEDVLSGDDALAWLESLTVGKEEELRAQAEVESEARIAEILGRPKTIKQPVQEPEVEAPEALFEEPEVTLYEEPEIEAVEPEPVAEAGEDVLSGDDALAWLESLTVGKEEELRAQAEVESEARIAEILGRPTTPEQPVQEPEAEALEAVFKEPEPEPEVTPYEEPVAEAVEPVLEIEVPQIEEPEPEPATQILEAPVTEAAEPEIEVEAPPVEEPEPEPVTQLVEEPVAKAAEPEIEVEAPPVEEPEPEPATQMVEEPIAEVAEPEIEVEAPPVEESEPEPVTLMVEEPVAEGVEPEAEREVVETPEPVSMAVEEPVIEAVGPTQDELDDMRNHLKRKRSDHDTRLKLSRALWAVGEIKEAMKNYGTLIKSGAKMGEIYEDLQQYLTTHPKDSDVLRTLGDAYMKDGDLERALEIYNEAMNTL